jgi:hypothetical protein
MLSQQPTLLLPILMKLFTFFARAGAISNLILSRPPNFRELLFHALMRIRVRKRAGAKTPRSLRALGSLLLVLYLKEADFAPLNACYRFPTSLCRLAAQPVNRLLAGTHGFFALP